jgi:hypothetical protein
MTDGCLKVGRASLTALGVGLWASEYRAKAAAFRPNRAGDLSIKRLKDQGR